MRLADDPTFVRYEPIAAPQGPSVELPFRFQLHSVAFFEDPFQRPSDVAAFREGTLDEAHYRACAVPLTRPPNGRVWTQEVVAQRKFDRSATTFMRLHGVLPSGHTTSVFVQHWPTITTTLPLHGVRGGDTLQGVDTWVRKVLRLPSAEEDASAVELTINAARPFVGYQLHAQSFVTIGVRNVTLRNTLQKLLQQRRNELFNTKAPWNEEMRALKAHELRHGSVVRVSGGRRVPLEDQIEAVDVEVHDAVVEGLHNDVYGETPAAMGHTILSFDFEGATPYSNGSMIEPHLEEVLLHMVSVVLKRTGHRTPYCRDDEVARLRAEAKVEESMPQKAAPPANVGDRTSAPQDIDWSKVDLRVAEDGLPTQQKRAAKRSAEAATKDVEHDVARFLISTLPVPTSPTFTLVLVRNELEMLQAIRRLGVRFRATVRLSHNGDGFDSLAWRQRVVLHSHNMAPTCWFPDHELCGSPLHVAFRKSVNADREARAAQRAQEEWRESLAKRGEKDVGSAPPDEVPGIWAPLPFGRDNELRVVLFNLWIAYRESHLPLGWLRAHPNSQVAAWFPVISAPRVDLAAAMAASAPPTSVLREFLASAVAACADHAAATAVPLQRAQHMLRFVEDPTMHPLDAEFLDTDVSRPCVFYSTIKRSNQLGDTPVSYYQCNSLLELDTMVLARTKWPKAKNSLAAVAERLKLPDKIEMPHSRMNKYGIAMRDCARLARRRGTTVEAMPEAAQVLANMLTVAIYCIFDSILPLRIVAKMKSLPSVLTMAWMTVTPAASVPRRGINYRVGSTCSRFGADLGFQQNTKVIPYDGPVEGARVPESKVGFDETAICASVDVNSLYPSIIMLFNLCWSTILLSRAAAEEAAAQGIELRHYHFYGRDYWVVQFTEGDAHMRRGILPTIMEYLINTRKAVKKKLKASRDAVEKELLDVKQAALKVLANSMYGFTGFAKSAMPALTIAAAITSEGRKINFEMERCINEDFTLARLRELRKQICARAEVPPKYWVLDATTPVMTGDGGDTDSIFLTVPVKDGSPTKLVALSYTYRRDPESNTYTCTVEECTDETSEEYRTALARYHKRRAMTQRQRQAARDVRNKLYKAAVASGAEVLYETEVVTEQTLTNRIAFELVVFVAEYMCSHCFNHRAAKMGGRRMGIDIDYIMKKRLLFKKKNYAGLIWESREALEEDDYVMKRAGTPDKKGDTPRVIAVAFDKILRSLQLASLAKAVETLRVHAMRILRNEVPVAEYAKKIKLNDPRTAADPTLVSHMNCYLRMQRRYRDGTLGNVPMPEVGMYMPIVLTIQRGVEKDSEMWEMPAYIEAHRDTMVVNRAHYLQGLVKKMEYLGIDELVRAAMGFHHQMKALQAASTCTSSLADHDGAAGAGCMASATLQVRKQMMRRQSDRDCAAMGTVQAAAPPSHGHVRTLAALKKRRQNTKANEKRRRKQGRGRVGRRVASLAD